MIHDPLIALRERFKAHLAATKGSVDDEDTKPQLAMEDQAMTTRPTTATGAIAALEWAVEEVQDIYGDEAVAAGSLTLALIRGAVDVLRTPPVRASAIVGEDVLTAVDMVECARLAAGTLGGGEAIAAVLGEVRRKLYAVNEAVDDLHVVDELRRPA